MLLLQWLRRRPQLPPPSQKKQTKTSWSQNLKNEGKKFTPVPRARQAQTRDRYYWNLKFTNHTTMSITKKTMLKTKLIILVMFLPMFPLLLSGPARLVFPPPPLKKEWCRSFCGNIIPHRQQWSREIFHGRRGSPFRYKKTILAFHRSIWF